MLAGVFRRHILTAHKGWLWGSSQQISCMSAAAASCSLWPCRGYSDRLLSKQNYAVAGLLRSQPFHSSAVRPKRRKQEEPPPRELDLLRYDMRDLGKSPKPAVVLGLAGLIPFVSAPLVMAVTETYLPEVAFAQIAYGVSILSFLGGARWGFAIPESSLAKPDWINLTNSMVPPLLAWVVMLMYSDNIIPAATMVIMGLGVSLHYDLSLLPTYPSWFKALLSILSVVAVLSLLATLVLRGFYPEKKIFSEE